MVSSFEGHHIAVMGLGRFGGGIGLTNWLLDQGARVRVLDRRSQVDLEDSIAQINVNQFNDMIEFVFGPHKNQHLDSIDFLFVNPAVPQPWKNPFIAEALDRSIPCLTEIELAYQRINPENVIVVTGSAGKSTTSAMIHHGLSELGVSTVLGGNIGGSLLQDLKNIDHQTVCVLELSSAMLYWLWGRTRRSENLKQRKIPLPPKIACITSYSPNHIDWHGDEEHYKSSKALLTQVLSSHSHLILPEHLNDWSASSVAQRVVVGNKDLPTNCKTFGQHNALNAALAASAILSMFPSFNRVQVQDAVGSFPGLKHRLYTCHQSSELIFIDDSKSTIPEATTLAIQALSERFDLSSIHLICGGYDKQVSLDAIRNLAPQIAGLYAIGSTASIICTPPHPNSFLSDQLETAMRHAISRAKQGDVILLSPGCASWDQFDNYEQRGHLFQTLAQELTKQ